MGHLNSEKRILCFFSSDNQTNVLLSKIERNCLIEKSGLLNCSIWGEKIDQTDNHRLLSELWLELSFIADVKVKYSCKNPVGAFQSTAMRTEIEQLHKYIPRTPSQQFGMQDFIFRILFIYTAVNTWIMKSIHV